MDKHRLKGKILLTAGGRKPPAGFLKDIIEEYNITYVIGVDKGCAYLIDEGIDPDSAIGDFDSLSLEYLKDIPPERRITFPSEKDKTDLHMAIEFIMKYQPELVVITG
ncbi:MAG: hypothetical protein KAS39_04335, partial [Actinomycetia bacterium]|nr:hypothetical protein [Actinomycetes bacterium]